MSQRCERCGTKLGAAAAGISLCPAGDELIFNYFLCTACDLWTVTCYHDRFMGEGSSHTSTMSRADGDRDVARIAQCTTPHDEHCRCPIHTGWYG